VEVGVVAVVVAGVVSVAVDVSVAEDDDADVELPPPQAAIKAHVITAIKVR
jgi:hypothetical protein